ARPASAGVRLEEPALRVRLRQEPVRRDRGDERAARGHRERGEPGRHRGLLAERGRGVPPSARAVPALRRLTFRRALRELTGGCPPPSRPRTRGRRSWPSWPAAPTCADGRWAPAATSAPWPPWTRCGC